MDLILDYQPVQNAMTLRDHEGREVHFANVRTVDEALALARECGFTGGAPTTIEEAAHDSP